MKKTVLILAIFSMFVCLSAQTVTLTFTGEDGAGRYAQLDSVSITNQTKGWQESIYWPDTVLEMQAGAGIGEAASQKIVLQLWQNNPNPFDGVTTANLTVPAAGAVSMEISDVNGRVIVGTKSYDVPAIGNHQFRITIANAGVYFMTARQNGKASSIKMVCNGGGSGNGIEYIGTVGNYGTLAEQFTASQQNGAKNNTPKYATEKPFNFGDQMEYVGYATINDGLAESGHLTQMQNQSQMFVLQFADSQYVAPTVVTDSVVSVLAVTADIAATIVSDGGTPIIACGVCWSTSPNPTVADSLSADSSGVGSFVSTMYGLEHATTYYVRAYATNSVGTSYGGELSFTTPDYPTVTTAAMGSVTTTLVASGGNVLADGGAPVSARGVCWSTSQNPTIADSLTVDSCGLGSFASVITLLLPNTTYYVRAYATNIAGTAYGSAVSVKTPKYPSVVTTAVSNITATAAVSGGNVTNDGGVAMVARGVCWSTSPNPSVSDSITVDGTTTGTYSSTLTGLAPATTYYVSAYATNTFGTAYGTTASFTTKLGGLPCTSTPTVTDYDKHVYNTVQIGTQCWMRESLRCEHYSNGTKIEEGSTTSSSTAYCYHANGNQSNDSIYGLLYNWKAVMGTSSSSSSNPSGVQGVCPSGWHVPSDAEFTQLVSYMSSQNSHACGGTSTYIAKALASTTGWGATVNECAVGNSAFLNNDAGFSAYPAGYYYGSTGNFGSNAIFWTTTQTSGTAATGRYLRYSYADVRSATYDKIDAFSVRCLKN